MHNKTLRIAMISVHSCPLGQPGSRDTGGMNVYVKELSKALGKCGHKVDIYTRAHDPKDEQTEEIYQNVRLVHIKAGAIEDMAKYTQYNHLDEFVKELDAFKCGNGLEYDVIHSHYWLSGEASRRLAKIWGIPHVTMFHTLGRAKESFNAGNKEPKRRTETELKVMEECSVIITSTDAEQDDIARFYDVNESKVRTIPCGVNLELFKATCKEEVKERLNLAGKDLVLFAGRIEPLKGIENLVKGFASVKNTSSSLLILGGDEYSRGETKKLRGMVRTLGLEGRVIFEESKPQEVMPLYYSAANVCVVPSYYETFGLVILEALACGTPVIASNIGIAPQVIINGRNGLIMENNSPKEITQALDRFFESNSDGMADATANLSEYSWGNIALEIKEVYRQSMGSHKELASEASF